MSEPDGHARDACDEDGPEPVFGNARRVFAHPAGGIASNQF
jgi:hypothetical protein